MSAIKLALQQSQKSGRSKTSKTMSAEVSPDSKCPICLDIFNNMSYLDLCLHKFCFRCIHEWSKNKAECPLCKQPFNSIYHSIKSEQDFKKYDLQPLETASFGTFQGVRFRYRTTLTGVQRQARRRTSPPPDNGVMFEAPTNLPQQQCDRYIQHIMTRLAARRRAAIEGRAVNSLREQEMVNFRRELYRRGFRVRNVRDGGRSRDTSAEFYRRNPACLHRLVPWLKRELTVLYGAHGSLVNIVQHIIMSRITRYDMEDGAIQEELRPFLQGRTEHFLHEFISFAKSPFNLEAYDQHAVYDFPAPSSNEDSSSNSSVIAISEDEENSTELDHPGASTSTLSHSVWDDETPGPSYSTTAEQARAERLSVLDSDSDTSLEEETHELSTPPLQMSPHNQTDLAQGECNNEECLSSDNDDCVIVGFVKPTAERTPELVQLSSDSDESGSEDTKEVPLLPQHIRFTSLSPAASQNSDPSGVGQSEYLETDQTDHHRQLDSKERCSFSKYSRHKTSSKSNRKGTERRFDSKERSRERHRSKDRDRQRRRRSRSGERRHCRSPVISYSSVSTHTNDRDCGQARDRMSQWDSRYKRRDGDHTYQLYSHYSQERNDSGTHLTHRQSYFYSSSHKSSDLRSRSRSHSRDSRRRDRRHSWTYSSSRSPSVKRKSHHDKPGGKRKYKTRHLDEPSSSILSNSYAEGDSVISTKHKKKSKEKSRRKSKERSRKTSRSLSVELVNEEKAYERSKRHHKKKKKHKKKSRRHKSNERTEKRSPTVITIDSDSDSCANDSATQTSSANKENPTDNTVDDTVDPTPADSLS